MLCRRSALVVLAGLLLVSAACRSAAPRVAVERPKHTSVALFKSEVPIPEKDNKTLPLWLIALSVRQGARSVGPVVAVVDTGAQVTVIDRAWAANSGLRVSDATMVATDITGRKLTTSAAADVRLGVGGYQAQPTDIVIIDFPEMLTRLGVFAIWSPQVAIAPDALYRFDFADGRLQVDDAERLSQPALPLCVGAGGRAAALTVDATIAGVAARLELDSGSNDTSVLANTQVGVALSAIEGGEMSTSYGAAGAFASRDLPPQRVEVGGFGGEYAVSVIEAEHGGPVPDCPSDGVIGLPLLEACRLEVTATHFSLTCAP